MKVLVGCRTNGTLRDAFRSVGLDAWSCDIRRDDLNSPFHIKDDIERVMERYWDMAIIYPPDRWLGNKGWDERRPIKVKRRAAALNLMKRLWNIQVPRLALITSKDAAYPEWRYPSQIINLKDFNENGKRWLWLRGLPPLKPDKEGFEAAMMKQWSDP